LILFIFIVIINLRSLVITITGLITRLSLSVTSITEGRFIYFLYLSEVTQGTSANFEVIFENNGTENVTVEIEIHVKDSSLNTVSSNYDDNYTLASLGIRNFSASWTPTTAGSYWVIANATYSSSVETKTVEENRSFSVTSEPVTIVTTTPAAAGGGGGGGGVGIPTIIIYNLTLEYPKYVYLNPGETTEISVLTTNNGNVNLHDLSVSVLVEKIEWRVHPENVSVLPTNTSQMFLILVTYPPDTPSKDYTLDFTLKSKEITEKGQITIIVSPISICSEVERAISNTEFLIDKISTEIEKAVAQGRNVTSALKSLREAREEFDTVKELYRSRKCEEAKENLRSVRGHLEQVVVELAESIQPVLYVPLTFLEFLKMGKLWTTGIIFVVIIIIILTILLVVLIAKKKIKIRAIIKPAIVALDEDRQRQKKKLQDLEKSYLKKQIIKKIYDRERILIEREIEKIEEQILTRYGTVKQLSVFEDLKKAYIEGIISKKMYNKTREKLANDIISEKKPRR